MVIRLCWQANEIYYLRYGSREFVPQPFLLRYAESGCLAHLWRIRSRLMLSLPDHSQRTRLKSYEADHHRWSLVPKLIPNSWSNIGKGTYEQRINKLGKERDKTSKDMRRYSLRHVVPRRNSLGIGPAALFPAKQSEQLDVAASILGQEVRLWLAAARQVELKTTNQRKRGKEDWDEEGEECI